MNKQGESYLSLLHSLKKWCFIEPIKKVRERCIKLSKGVETLKNRITISSKPLKILSMYQWKEPSCMKSILMFRTDGNCFIEKCEAFRVSY